MAEEALVLSDSVNQHYLDKVMELAQERHVAATEDIFDARGTGIAPQHLSVLFNQGFSTRGPGHGFSLHLSANWAHEMGGQLYGPAAGSARERLLLWKFRRLLRSS